MLGYRNFRLWHSLKFIRLLFLCIVLHQEMSILALIIINRYNEWSTLRYTISTIYRKLSCIIFFILTENQLKNSCTYYKKNDLLTLHAFPTDFQRPLMLNKDA